MWLVSFVVAVLPALPIPYFGENYYGRSSVCIALPITNEKPPGMTIRQFFVACTGFEIEGLNNTKTVEDDFLLNTLISK